MSRIGILDKDGSTHPIAWKLEKEGHDVKYYIHEPEGKLTGDGLVTKAEDVEEVIEWKPDVVVGYKLPDECERATKAGLVVVGCSHESCRIEEDRMWGAQVARRCGQAVPETKEFTTIEKARRWVEDNGARKRWVFKASGPKVDVSSTHICIDHDHLMQIMAFEETLNRAKRFVLQERIDGIEISIEGWYHYEKGWMPGSVNSTLERKRLFAGDKGIMTGCMGNIVFTWPQDYPLLFKQTLEKWTGFLKNIKWVGPWDLNTIIDYKHHTPWFLEPTPRIGWAAFEAYMSLIGNVGNFFVHLARGDWATAPPSVFEMAAAVPLYTPTLANIPIRFPLDEDPRLLPQSLWRDDDDVIRLVGIDEIPGHDCVGNATASGTSLERIMSEIYEDVIPQVIAPDLAFRDDIGEKASRDMEVLEQWGYVMHQDPLKREAVRSFVSVG